MESDFANSLSNIENLIKSTQYVKNFTFSDYQIFDNNNYIQITDNNNNLKIALKFENGNLNSLLLQIDEEKVIIDKITDREYYFHIGEFNYPLLIDSFGNTENTVPNLTKNNYDYKFTFNDYIINIKKSRYFLTINGGKKLEVYIGSNKDLHDKIVIFSNYKVFKLYDDVGDPQLNRLYGTRSFIYRKEYLLAKRLIKLNNNDTVSITNDIGHYDKYNVLFNINGNDLIYNVKYENNLSVLQYLTFNITVQNVNYTVLFDFLDITSENNNNNNNVVKIQLNSNSRMFYFNSSTKIFLDVTDLPANFNLQHMYKFLFIALAYTSTKIKSFYYV